MNCLWVCLFYSLIGSIDVHHRVTYSDVSVYNEHHYSIVVVEVLVLAVEVVVFVVLVAEIVSVEVVVLVVAVVVPYQ